MTKITKEAAHALGWTPEARAEKKRKKAEEQAAKIAAKVEARRKREEERAAHRARVTAERTEAAEADQALGAALDELQACLDSVDARKRDEAQQEVDACKEGERLAGVHVTRLEHELQKAKRDYSSAVNRRMLAEDKLAGMIDRMTNGVEAVTKAAQDAWERSKAAWKALPTGYRKKTRDRALKNRAKEMLGK